MGRIHTDSRMMLIPKEKEKEGDGADSLQVRLQYISYYELAHTQDIVNVLKWSDTVVAIC